MLSDNLQLTAVSGVVNDCCYVVKERKQYHKNSFFCQYYILNFCFSELPTSVGGATLLLFEATLRHQQGDGVS